MRISVGGMVSVELEKLNLLETIHHKYSLQITSVYSKCE